MAVGIERRAITAVSGLDQSLLLRPLQSNAMPYDPMPHTEVGQPVIDTASVRTSTDRLELDPAVHKPAVAPSLQSQVSKKRRPSKVKVSPEIRRSSSTPHMRNLALANSGELSPTADKRRNKLGYHRTSVACGHCRRRKIRCLVAPEDPQGRCANCIRLKKECNFYPVEQNPEAQRPLSGPGKDTGPNSAVVSATNSPHPPPQISGPPSYSGAPANAAAFGPPQVPHSSGVPSQHPSYSYPHQIDTQWTAPAFLPSSSVAESSPSSAGYWRPSPSTANSTYGSESNMSGGHTPAAMSASSNMSYGAHGEAHGWSQPSTQPPTRSMSYGNIEGLPQPYPGPNVGLQQPEYARRNPSYPYPSSLDTNPAIVHSTTLAGNAPAPLSAPIVSNQQYSYPQTWSPYATMQPPSHDMPITGRSMSGQWYADPTQLGQLQEEGAPPAAYSNPAVPQYFSGA